MVLWYGGGMEKVVEDSIVVAGDEEGSRLDQFLCVHKLCDTAGHVFSRSAISRAITRGDLQVNHRAVKPHYIVRSGDIVTVAQQMRTVVTQLVSNSAIMYGVLFEDRDFIVINKPAGLVVHPAQCGDESNTLVHGLIARYPEMIGVGDDVTRPGIVHRLDRDTSGVMVVARTAEAFAALKARFKERAVRKTYSAVVHGIPKAPAAVIDFPIARSVRSDRWIALRTRRDPYKGTARAAHTAYRTVRHGGAVSLLKVAPTTGRTHQIRVHLQAIGHPIVGDVLYKIRGVQNVPIARQALHATTLRFTYRRQQWVFSAPLPEDIRGVVAMLVSDGAEA